ncbi:uncharacterized protein BO80DRAFT_43444 [Aspergillus ibericus CBS 121593]|uniref:Secreted protein n=1 Tax=Aspergillus ibericus CBS 121593 TaxID=1448316 RepID=A0A395H3R4_9EURO|nr:hypothetical protein BO80DRAFT_43444 [Aspergillus ibericus CBS 121593]RAL02260.1 hypothetical protein BO80DRAFT_43444 [Aspergillus ibericus CBS 121593]
MFAWRVWLTCLLIVSAPVGARCQRPDANRTHRIFTPSLISPACPPPGWPIHSRPPASCTVVPFGHSASFSGRFALVVTRPGLNAAD